MSDPATPPPPRRSPTRPRARRLLLIASVALLAILLLTTLLYLNRRAAARQVLVGWLERQGVQADMAVERVELDSLVASLRIGDPDDPDVVVERVEVDFALGAPWSRQGLGVTPSRIRLVRPVVRASIAGGQLSFGSLDPLIERFTARPPRPDARSPLVLVEGGRVRLATDYGPAEIHGDARVEDGKLMRLAARMPAADLRSGELHAEDLALNVDLTTTGDRVALRAGLFAAAAADAGASAEAVRFGVVADLPYPDLRTRRGDGRAILRGALSANRLDLASIGETTGLSGRFGFDGATSGWIEAFDIHGRGDLALAAERLAGEGAVRSVRLQLTRAQTTLRRNAQGLAWKIDGSASAAAGRLSTAGVDVSNLRLAAPRLVAGGRGSAAEIQGPVAASAARLAWGELDLKDVRSDIALDLVADAGLRVELAGRFRAARSAWPLLGAPAGDDLPDLAAMKQALANFALDLPSVRLSTGSSGTRLLLASPARIRPANGGELTISAAGGPLFAAARGESGGGALSLASTPGAGLPAAVFDVPSWRLTSTGFEASLDGRLALDFDLGRGIDLRTRGALTSSNGRLSYVASGCSPVSLERLELGENDVFDLSGSLCPTQAPLLLVQDGGWRVQSRLASASADASFLALGVRGGSGQLVAAGGPAGVGLDLQVDHADVLDLTSPRRFSPLVASGSVRLAQETWRGGFALTRLGAVIGSVDLTHDGRSGAGGMTIDAPSIQFSEGGLQPDDLSPLASDFVGSPAVGSVAFEGRLDWREGAEGSSRGRLDIPRLDFVSPAGPVQGLSGSIDFTNLAPLSAAPGQRLSAERIESITPLTDVDLVFGLSKAELTVEAADLNAASGVVRVEPLAIPLDLSQPVSGVIVLERVQLNDLIAGSGFGDKVRIDAVVSGRLPFTWDPAAGVRVAAGALAAVQPGRLSIRREALTGLEAGGGGEGVPENTVQDLAYQAMENLSFDLLSAEVNSLDAGRLGVIFRIRGRHDPPQHQELHIPIDEFISRKFLERELPLPSGTSIDLTLDTTLNANQLVSDLLAYNRARNGDPEPSR